MGRVHPEAADGPTISRIAALACDEVHGARIVRSNPTIDDFLGRFETAGALPRPRRRRRGQRRSCPSRRTGRAARVSNRPKTTRDFGQANSLSRSLVTPIEPAEFVVGWCIGAEQHQRRQGGEPIGSTLGSPPWWCCRLCSSEGRVCLPHPRGPAISADLSSSLVPARRCRARCNHSRRVPASPRRRRRPRGSRRAASWRSGPP